jgi:hypothetical protein
VPSKHNYAAYTQRFNFKDNVVMLFGDYLYVYWLEFTQIRSMKILRGSRGGHRKEAKSVKNLFKNSSVVPVKVDFLMRLFFLFKAILSAVFENTIFNPMKIIQGAFFIPYFSQRSFFERQLWGYMTKILFLYLCKSSQYERHGSQ